MTRFLSQSHWVSHVVLFDSNTYSVLIPLDFNPWTFLRSNVSALTFVVTYLFISFSRSLTDGLLKVERTRDGSKRCYMTRVIRKLFWGEANSKKPTPNEGTVVYTGLILTTIAIKNSIGALWRKTDFSSLQNLYRIPVFISTITGLRHPFLFETKRDGGHCDRGLKSGTSQVLTNPLARSYSRGT